MHSTIQYIKSDSCSSGEPGVGKTAIAEGLAHRIVKNEVPKHLKGTLYNLDLGALFAGAGKGEYEQVWKVLMVTFDNSYHYMLFKRVKGVIDGGSCHYSALSVCL